MKRPAIQILAAALAVQVGLFVMIKLWPAEQKLVKPKSVVAVDGEVTAIEVVDGGVQGGKEERLELAKASGKWVLASGGGYPVESKKVEDLLSKLKAAKAGAAVASREAYHRKLEVAAARFQRKVTLTTAKGKFTFYLGTSPALKKVHVRLDGKKDVYAAGPLSTWDVGASATSWVDTAYFKLERAKIASFTLQNGKGTISVTKEGTDWKLAAGEGKLSKTEVDSLVSTLSYLSLRAPVGKKVEASYGLAKPAATLTVRLKTLPKAPASMPASAPASTQPVFETVRLRIGAKQGTAYFAKRDASPFVVTIDASSADTLVSKALADLLDKPKEGKAAKGAMPGMPGMPSLPKPTLTP